MTENEHLCGCVYCHLWTYFQDILTALREFKTEMSKADKNTESARDEGEI